MKFSRLAAMAALPAASAKVYFKEQFNDEASQSSIVGIFRRSSASSFGRRRLCV
jgi:hypothetical protein